MRVAPQWGALSSINKELNECKLQLEQQVYCGAPGTETSISEPKRTVYFERRRLLREVDNWLFIHGDLVWLLPVSSARRKSSFSKDTMSDITLLTEEQCYTYRGEERGRLLSFSVYTFHLLVEKHLKFFPPMKCSRLPGRVSLRPLL